MGCEDENGRAVAILAADHIQPWERSVPQHKEAVRFQYSPPEEALRLRPHKEY
jgi:hypothetical protein